MNDFEKIRESLEQANEQLSIRLQQQAAELAEAQEALKRQRAVSRKSETAFRESEHYSRNLFELLPIGLALCRMDGSLIDVNPAYAQMLGRTVAETLELTYWDVTPSVYAEQEAVLLQNLKKTGHYGPYEKEYIHKDGHLVPVRLSGRLVQKGRESYIWSSVENITDRKRAEEEAGKMRVFLDSIIECIPHMVFVKEARELRFVLFNRAGEKLLGCEHGSILGKNDYDLFPKEEADFFTAKDREVLSNRKILDIPEEPIHTSKGVRLLHTKKVPLYDSQGQAKYLLGISEDITESKQMQQSLLRRTEQLAHSKAELEQLELFAFAATHDLQEPLRTIVFYADLLKSQIPDSPSNGAVLASLESIERSAARMRTMMEQLRELARIETGGSRFEKINLNEVIQEVVSHLELLITESGGCVEVEALPAVLGDLTQMQLIFQNLIGNGLKFRKPGQSPKVRVTGKKLKDGFVEITVQDNGIGFDERYLDRIFKPFQRLHGPKDYPGSGIGLAICQKITARHGGKIAAASQPGAGSSFRLTLPSSID